MSNNNNGGSGISATMIAIIVGGVVLLFGLIGVGAFALFSVSSTNDNDEQTAVEVAVALTIAAQEGVSTLTVDEIVALTVAATGGDEGTSSDGDSSGSEGDSGSTEGDSGSTDGNTSGSEGDSGSTGGDSGSTDGNTSGSEGGSGSTDGGTPAVAQLKVNVSSANVRTGPGTYCEVLRIAVQDTVYKATTRTSNNNWYTVELDDGKIAWIANSVTDPVDAALVDALPTAPDIPACATWTATPTATATWTATPTYTPTPTGQATTDGTATATTDATATSTPTPTYTPSPEVTLSEPIVATYTIVVNNQSDVDVCYIFAHSSLTSDYGENKLIGGARLSAGTSMVMTYEDGGGYSLYAQECLGGSDSYWEEFDKFDDYTWNLSSSNQQTP